MRPSHTPQGAFPARRPFGVVLAGCALTVALCLVAAVLLGPAEVPITLAQIARSLSHHLLGAPLPPGEAMAVADAVIWQIRVPHALTAALVGALLGLAGVALQGLLMNPLADPYTVGVSSGAAVGAAVAEITGVGGLLMGFGASALAFGGGMGALALVFAIARVGGRVSVQSFLLAGVIVGAMLWSLIPLLLTLAHRSEDLGRIYAYLIGSIQGADWTRAALLAGFLLPVWAALRFSARDLNLMTLGEESAAHLGVEIERVKRSVLVVGALATAAAVASAGIIGFVGLVVPHAARGLVGPDHRRVLPLAALLGAALLTASDTVARVYLNEMPVGVITSLIGAPVFCWILRRRRAAAW
jgi:iron complex transport system permease protein